MSDHIQLCLYAFNRIVDVVSLGDILHLLVLLIRNHKWLLVSLLLLVRRLLLKWLFVPWLNLIFVLVITGARIWSHDFLYILRKVRLSLLILFIKGHWWLVLVTKSLEGLALRFYSSQFRNMAHIFHNLMVFMDSLWIAVSFGSQILNLELVCYLHFSPSYWQITST